MKHHYIFLLLFPSLLACADKQNNKSFIPSEYNFPEKQIGAGRTFVYLDSVKGKQYYKDIFLREKNGSNYVIERHYTPEGTFDSLVYLNSKLIEEYRSGIADQQNVKGIILKDTLIDNGTKLGKKISKARFNYDDFSITLEAESEFVKDTTFAWHGEEKGTMVIKSSVHNSLQSKLDTSQKKDLFVVYFAYMAKGIGVIRISTLIRNEWTTKELIEIKDFSN